MKATLQALAPEQDVLEKVLVKNACAFLKQRLQRLAPDAVLTHAWDSFYRTYTNILRRMAAEFHLEAGESEDLVQEVWAQVIVHLSGTVSDSQGLFVDTPAFFVLNATQFDGGGTATSVTFTNSAGAVAASVPEPSTWVMVTLGFGVLGYAAFRRREANVAALFP